MNQKVVFQNFITEPTGDKYFSVFLLANSASNNLVEITLFLLRQKFLLNVMILCIEVLRTFSQQLSFMMIVFILLLNQVEGLVEGFVGALEHVCVCIGSPDPMELI